jgi:hypothetical protein
MNWNILEGTEAIQGIPAVGTYRQSPEGNRRQRIELSADSEATAFPRRSRKQIKSFKERNKDFRPKAPSEQSLFTLNFARCDRPHF